LKHFLLILSWFVIGAIATRSLPGRRPVDSALPPMTSAAVMAVTGANAAQGRGAQDRRAFFGDLRVDNSGAVDGYIFDDTDTQRAAYWFGRGAVNYNPGGLAGAWAEENSRKSLSAAFERSETFATSGNRISIRLFAGWRFAPDLHLQENAIAAAYEQGVPMGETLHRSEVGDEAPLFYVWAERDPASLPLQRLQIIKSWIDARGESREYTYDVACAGGARPDPDSHRCPHRGVFENLSDCADVGMGAAQLASVWRDPQFDAGQGAAYSAQVLEIPSCQAAGSNQVASLDEVRSSSPFLEVIQERAWSSPVWVVSDTLAAGPR
jgi:hypothetical protein